MTSVPLGIAVRDRLHEQLAEAGYQCRTRAVTGREWQGALRQALQSAVADYLQHPDLAHLAELAELLEALAQQDGHDAQALQDCREQLAQAGGRYQQGLILEALGPRPPQEPTGDD